MNFLNKPKNGLFKIMSIMFVNFTHCSPLEIMRKSVKLMVIQNAKIIIIGKF